MNRNDVAIVSPVKDGNSPPLGPFALMVATQPDLKQICRELGYGKKQCRRLFMSRLFVGTDQSETVAVAGPMIGAPYAVMILETLIAWGARQFIFFGWCGAISPDVKIGDIILPTAAIIDEGTSRHYRPEMQKTVDPDPVLLHKIKKQLVENGLEFHAGKIWTTDAIYRETKRKVDTYHGMGALGVEMELSALLTVSRFHRVDLAGILVVSDEVSSEKWRPGYKTSQFARSRKQALDILRQLSKTA